MGLVKTAGQGFAETGKAGIRDAEWDWDEEGKRDGDWKNWYARPRMRGSGMGLGRRRRRSFE